MSPSCAIASGAIASGANSRPVQASTSRQILLLVCIFNLLGGSISVAADIGTPRHRLTLPRTRRTEKMGSEHTLIPFIPILIFVWWLWRKKKTVQYELPLLFLPVVPDLRMTPGYALARQYLLPQCPGFRTVLVYCLNQD